MNGAKYDFLILPFGLQNAPAIFQRCVDDILRDYIGKFAYVYIDGVLINITFLSKLSRILRTHN